MKEEVQKQINKMTLKPDALLVQPILPGEKKTDSGIVIPQMDKQRPETGKVLKTYQGSGVKEGAEVLFMRFGPMEIEIETEKLFIVFEKDVIAIL